MNALATSAKTSRERYHMGLSLITLNIESNTQTKSGPFEDQPQHD